MKKLVIFGVCMLMCISLIGCGGSDSPEPGDNDSAQNNQPSQDEASNAEVKVIESGYGISESGYVHYGVGVENTSSDQQVMFYTVHITGKDAEGKIVFADEQVMGNILPGEKQYFGMQAGSGAVPESVEITVDTKESNWSQTDKRPAEYFTIANTNVVNSQYGSGADFTGEITLLEDIEEVSTMGYAMVSVLLRDSNGAIVYGTNGFSDNLTVGQTVPFEVNAYTELPEYATYEVYALPW